MSKPLAKSLHTVTVLVRVAKALHERRTNPRDTTGHALALALDILGLSGMPDTYGLVAAAIKQLNK